MNVRRILGVLYVTLGFVGFARGADPVPQLFVMNADGTEVKPLVNMDDYDGHGSPTFSADGSKIAFDAWRASAGESSSNAHVFVANADGSEPKDLGPGAMPSFSPDGKRLAFTRYDPSGVWIMNADGGEAEMIDAQGWSGHFSPDGRALAYAFNSDGGDVAIFDLKSRARRTILEGDQDDDYVYVRWNLCWSPDGKQVCFKAQKADDTCDLAVCEVEGSAKGFKVLVEGEMDEDAAWHPDGRLILVSLPDTMRKTRQLFLIDSTMDPRPRYLVGQPADRDNINACWSPDGKRIVFATRPRPAE
jgi:Tol biopolymer transport system component